MRTAVITGGSGVIGQACALRLAREGIAVAINYRTNYKRAEETRLKITEEGGTASLHIADVTDPGEVRKLFDEVMKTYGRIDILINNAGIVKDEFLLMMKKESLEQSLDVNVKSYFYCAQQAALKMYRRKSGVIINMSSVSSVLGLAGQSVYAATKGAINSMTAVLAKELAPSGIRVNAVAPGFVESEMLDKVPENQKEEYLKAIPMKRFCKPEEVAEAVNALCSEAFGYMTGQTIILDGGLSV